VKPELALCCETSFQYQTTSYSCRENLLEVLVHVGLLAATKIMLFLQQGKTVKLACDGIGILHSYNKIKKVSLRAGSE